MRVHWRSLGSLWWCSKAECGGTELREVGRIEVKFYRKFENTSGITTVKQKDGPIFVSNERKKKLKIKRILATEAR